MSGTGIATAFRPSRPLRTLDRVAAAYRHVFARSRAAPLLSRPHPVRYEGYDLDLIVRAVHREADGVVSATLAAPDGAALPRWVPGAHVDLVLPSGRQRQYSLCGDPSDTSAYQIAVRRLADGTGGSKEVHDNLAEGAAVQVRGPRNAFRLVEASSYLFVAAGIGITPILPMVRQCHRVDAPWRLVYLGRSRESMPFVDELPGYTGGAVTVLDGGAADYPGSAAIAAYARPGAAVYLCGPPSLMDSLRASVFAANPTASVHTERFSPPPVVDGNPFTVRLHRTGTTISVGSDESALTAIRRVLPGAAYSCRQGFCGTCRVGVLSGDVEHRDRRLTPAERESEMLVCVSRSAGGELVLDL